MLTITIFISLAGVLSLIMALLYNLFIGSPTGVTPMVILALGGLLALGFFVYHHRKTGRIPGAETIDNPTAMNTRPPAPAVQKDPAPAEAAPARPAPELENDPRPAPQDGDDTDDPFATAGGGRETPS